MVILNRAEVTVTKERLIVGNQTYALAGVTSVRHELRPPRRVGPTVVLIIGFSASVAALRLGSVITGYVGLILLAIGLFWERSLQPRHTVILDGPSGEMRALTDCDERLARRVVEALDQAISDKK
jgi:hypothetical protein